MGCSHWSLHHRPQCWTWLSREDLLRKVACCEPVAAENRFLLSQFLPMPETRLLLPCYSMPCQSLAFLSSHCQLLQELELPGAPCDDRPSYDHKHTHPHGGRSGMCSQEPHSRETVWRHGSWRCDRTCKGHLSARRKSRHRDSQDVHISALCPQTVSCSTPPHALRRCVHKSSASKLWTDHTGLTAWSQESCPGHASGRHRTSTWLRASALLAFDFWQPQRVAQVAAELELDSELNACFVDLLFQLEGPGVDPLLSQWPGSASLPPLRLSLGSCLGGRQGPSACKHASHPQMSSHGSVPTRSEQLPRRLS